MNGNFVASGTYKEADADAIVKKIAEIGIPSIIASDVNPAPGLVSKAAARFNVKVFMPQRSMQQKEKSEIAAGLETGNWKSFWPSAQRRKNRAKNFWRQKTTIHERDALSAAVKCYRLYANRLRQIELTNTHLDKDKLKHLVIQGISLKRAAAMLEGRERS